MTAGEAHHVPAVVCLYLCLLLASGCGLRDDDLPAAVDAGAHGQHGSIAADGGNGRSQPAAESGDGVDGTKCGWAVCVSPPLPRFITACCADEATSTCSLAMRSGPCIKPVAGDPRCPAFGFRGIVMLPSCCTQDGMCGLDATMYGMPGCIELAAAAERASAIGVSGDFPVPRPCEGSDAQDAGAADGG